MAESQQKPIQSDLTKKRIVLFLVLVGIVVLLYIFVLRDWLTFQHWNQSKEIIRAYAYAHYPVSALLFMAAYILLACFSLPGLPLLTMAAAFVFGTMEALLYVMVSATFGALGALLITRYFIGQWVQQKYAGKLRGLNRKIEGDGLYYLLTLRLIPAFPFTWINLACGLTTINWFHFTWVTAVGILPGTFVMAFTGSQLGEISRPQDLLSPSLWLALTLLGLLALLPLLFKKYFKRNEE